MSQIYKSQVSTRGELAQLARAPALHAGGQGFDSLILHNAVEIQQEQKVFNLKLDLR